MRDAFIHVIRAIENEFRQTGRLPLWHVEAHGNTTALGSLPTMDSRSLN
jgi:hypothetical protein